MEDQSHKPHRKAKEKKKHSGDTNPKAFAVSNPGKLARQAARSQDIKEKSFHVPLADRTPDQAPAPRLVSIVGPPGVGKTTLLKSLVRRYAKETLQEPQGPITVVTSKKQRLTFQECPNTLEAMVDTAKVADIVLLMIDGNYGFEMETMEFLNVLSATGMPGNVFGVLTHLDLFRKPQALKDAKKRLKHRLWSELYNGAHLFYLSGVINGRYPDREIHNLSRFLSVMKNPRPLVWRNSHCYSVIDSFRDVTHPTAMEEDKNCDRTIALSGYLRGTNLSAEGQRITVPGLGDFTVSQVQALPDPCPTPQMIQAMAKITGKTGRRRLDEKDKKVHAPMSDRSGLKIDGDAIWITRDKGFNFDKDAEGVERGEGEELIISLQDQKRLLGQTDDGVQLFRGGEKISKVAEEEDTGRKKHRTVRVADRDEDEDEIMDDEGFVSGEEDAGSDEEAEFSEQKLGKLFRQDKEKTGNEDDFAFADSDSDMGSLGSESEGEDENDDSDVEEEEDDDDDEDQAGRRWKENLTKRASSMYGNRPSYRTADLARLMYNTSISADEVLQRWKGEVDEEEEEDDIEAGEEDDFFKKSKKEKDNMTDDRALPAYDYEQLAVKWSLQDNIELIRERFTSAALNGADGEGDDDGDGFGDDDSEGDGEFEDLETGEVHKAESKPVEDFDEERAQNAKRKEELKLRFEQEDREGFANDKANARREAGADADEFGEDEWYDRQKAVIQKQLDINNAEFEALDDSQRVSVEGYRAGQYVTITIEGVPAEFTDNFDARMPIIIGGVTPTEDRFGFCQARIKRHRWHKKILKSGDPLIISLGWRRFQTLPMYSTSDNRTRNRLLKYTPEHMHCFATWWGPLIAPNTGFAAFNTLSSQNPGFRIAATGTILSVDETTETVKKLKLTGAPYKIFKNTAFIKDMFNSSLEVAKMEGVAIKTVSGIRGQIKKALSKDDGKFRATFEDKILMSDLVIMRAWYPIKPHRYYNPVTNLLGGWQPMRLTGEVRRDQGLATPQNKDSKYKPIERQTRHFNPLRVPRALAAELPYKSQIIQTKAQRHKTYTQKRAVVLGGDEKKARDLMQKLTTIRKDTIAKRHAKKEEKRVEFRKKMAVLADKKEQREKRETKDYWRSEGKKRKADESGGGGKRRR
ncbi:Ribosome biogenesis protein bms1 [Apiospora arundinis]|uniref:Ribosome biogenesis protein bms1 n=1 Tax=Apiospora arundinis TaxID=335852 RepID=A0ABR2IUF7_9PEZI